jgi:hypothetical protein
LASITPIAPVPCSTAMHHILMERFGDDSEKPPTSSDFQILIHNFKSAFQTNSIVVAESTVLASLLSWWTREASSEISKTIFRVMVAFALHEHVVFGDVAQAVPDLLAADSSIALAPVGFGEPQAEIADACFRIFLRVTEQILNTVCSFVTAFLSCFADRIRSVWFRWRRVAVMHRFGTWLAGLCCSCYATDLAKRAKAGVFIHPMHPFTSTDCDK